MKPTKAPQLTGHDLYLQYTDPDGRTHIQEHRVWDSEVFIAARMAEVQRANNERKPGTGAAKVELSNREAYLRSRRK